MGCRTSRYAQPLVCSGPSDLNSVQTERLIIQYIVGMAQLR
jgi:hypothetical protein